MTTFQFQYRREQRVDFEVEAATEEEAEEKAWKYVESLSLDSLDDESDDPGELECLSSTFEDGSDPERDSALAALPESDWDPGDMRLRMRFDRLLSLTPNRKVEAGTALAAYLRWLGSGTTS
jgi:hypothetical protein